MTADFASRVLSWYAQSGRKDLPWQHDRNLYRVWVSEIMLQQTQVQTVIPYYERFVATFPDVLTLANARLDDVLHHWSGLGYYARARNMHLTAGIVRDQYDGLFPDVFESVVALPGIGRSTAGAILALALDQRHAILDGNVKRVLARHAAIEGWPGNSKVSERLWEVAEILTPAADVANYTQAMMDIGATLCTRGQPMCVRCPVSADCVALATNAIAELPGRKPRKDKPLRHTTMLLATDETSLYLRLRPSTGIWGGLWSLPEISNEDAASWCQRELSCDAVKIERWTPMRHSFSHYDLAIQPVHVRVRMASRKVSDSNDATWYRLGERPPGGIAAPVRKLINTLEQTQNVQNR